MTSNEARQRLPEINRELADREKHERDLRLREADLRHRLNAIGPRPRDPFDQREADKFRESLCQLDDGITTRDGISFSLLEPLVGRPGLRETTRRIEALRAERAECERVIAEWPEPSMTRRYRYTGAAFKCVWSDDRYLAPGEVVDLTESQAAGFADRFEAVVEEPTAAS